MLDTKYCFTCGDSDPNEIIKKCQNIMTRIVVQTALDTTILTIYLTIHKHKAIYKATFQLDIILKLFQTAEAETPMAMSSNSKIGLLIMK